MRRCVHLVGLLGLVDALAVSVLLGPGPLNAADLSDLGRPPSLAMVGAGKDGDVFFASSELFEPLGRRLTVYGAMHTSCSGQTTTLLPTGRELAGLRAASPFRRRQRLNSTASGTILTITPSSVAVVPGTSVTFTPSGGTGGYAWSFVENENKSGGTVDQGGLYTAGATAGVTDVLRVTDVMGDVGTVKIFVVYLQIEPPSKTLTVGATQSFTALGFIDSYTFQLLPNQSGATISTSGLYTAGNDAGTDTIRLTDSLGFTARAVVTVVGPLVIKPSAVTLEPLESKSFTASGGQEPYIFSLFSESDASVTLDGVYTAGGTSDAGDVVRVTDSIGNTAEADVSVTTDYRPPSGAGCGTTPEHLFPLLAFAALLMLLPRRSRE
jgi:hypothetical protein